MFIHFSTLGAYFFDPWGPHLTPFAQDLHFDSFLDAFLAPLGPPWEAFWARWGPSGVTSGAFGGPLGSFGAPFGVPWVLIGSLLDAFEPPWCLFWAPSGPSWTPEVLLCSFDAFCAFFGAWQGLEMVWTPLLTFGAWFELGF